MSQRGQITIAAVGGLTAVMLGTVVLLHLSRIASGGAGAQTAADMAALAGARILASDSSAAPSTVRAAAAFAARANGARLTDLQIERVGAVATAVDVTAAVDVDGSVPIAGPQRNAVPERARAGVVYMATLPGGAFRPVDLHGAQGPLAAVAAAEAQVGWPYVWGGKKPRRRRIRLSRSTSGFCQRLVPYWCQTRPGYGGVRNPHDLGEIVGDVHRAAQGRRIVGVRHRLPIEVDERKLVVHGNRRRGQEPLVRDAPMEPLRNPAVEMRPAAFRASTT